MFPVTGLVFCGGGGRGAYQIGVWQALRERGLDKYTAAVSGASVGALNAALFACGNLPLAERVWTSLKRGDITDPAETAGRVINSVLKFLGSDDRTITIDPDRLSRGGIFSLEGLVNVIAENGVNDCVSGCGTPCFACCHNTEGNYPEYFDRENNAVPRGFLRAPRGVPGGGYRRHPVPRRRRFRQYSGEAALRYRNTAVHRFLPRERRR